MTISTLSNWCTSISPRVCLPKEPASRRKHGVYAVSLIGSATSIISSRYKLVSGTSAVGTGYSWLRQYFPHVAAGAIAAGDVTIAGVGRLAFAYPDFARDLLERGKLYPEKCCLACSGCTELMRAGGPTGCIVRDREFYRLPRRGRDRKD